MSSPAATDAASSSSSAAALPVGFRFRPTDEELVRHYLKAKIAGRPHPDLLFIPDVDLSACEPWDLPAMSVIKSDDPEWFFFAARDRKYPGGHRSNRSTAAGYWKATGKDRLIRSSRPAGALIGIKKTLVFHRGRAPRGLRTAWIMHEYRTTEPQFESGLNGSFVLYRLFNKHEDETPGSNSDQQLHSASPPSASTSSAGNHQNDTGVVQVQAAAISSIVKNETLPSDLSQMTAIRKATDDADQSMAHLPANVNNKQKTAAKEDAFLDVLTQLPDLQPEQRYSGFPIISSPMRPYSDNPCVGNLGEQDLSAYFDSIIAEQDLQDLLLSPTYAQMDKYPIGNIEPNPTAGAMLINSSNSKALLEDSWTTSDSNQHADATNATSCSSAINMQQTETGGANHEARAHTSMVYSDLPQGHNLGNHYQLQSMPYPLMESQMCGALCSAGSWTPYQQNLLNAMAEPSRSGMTTSDAFDAQGGWEPTPLMQQFTDPDFIDPQQGTAARRIRLVCSVQRASVSQPVLTSHLESEDEAESCNNTGISSKNHNEENVNAASRIVDGELTRIQREGDVLTQVDSLVEVTQDILPHAKLAPGTNLKQRIKLESAHTTKSDHLPGEPSPETIRQHQHAQGRSVVRLLWLSLIVLLVLVGVWKSLNY